MNHGRGTQTDSTLKKEFIQGDVRSSQQELIFFEITDIKLLPNSPEEDPPHINLSTFLIKVL